MRRYVGLAITALLFASCSGGGEEAGGSAAASADTLTRRQRDSIIANSRLPQAGAVGKALGAADAASARARMEDSIAAARRD
jgi:hypothetical protein